MENVDTSAAKSFLGLSIETIYSENFVADIYSSHTIVKAFFMCNKFAYTLHPKYNKTQKG